MIPIIATTKKIYLVTSLGGFNFPILTWGYQKNTWSKHGQALVVHIFVSLLMLLFFPMAKTKLKDETTHPMMYSLVN